jgi:ParB family chromosome partitioning protein
MNPDKDIHASITNESFIPEDTSPQPESTASPSDEMAKRKPAGFGQFANALSRDALFATSKDLPHVVELGIDQIDPNPDQPRKHFDQEQLAELAATIEEVGLIQPITVAKQGERYLLVAGERRYRAHQLLGRDTIAAIVTDGDPDVIALIENVQRQALDPLEEAHAYQQLIDRHDYSQAELGQVVGKKQNTVSETLSLSRLAAPVVERYRTSDTRPSKNVLVEIAKEPDEERQLDLLDEVLSSKLGVRAVRERRKSPTPSDGTTSDAPSSVRAANARKDRIIRSLAVSVKRAAEDARVEDFPAGSDALERLRALKAQLDAALAPVLEHARMGDAKALK